MTLKTSEPVSIFIITQGELTRACRSCQACGLINIVVHNSNLKSTLQTASIQVENLTGQVLLFRSKVLRVYLINQTSQGEDWKCISDPSNQNISYSINQLHYWSRIYTAHDLIHLRRAWNKKTPQKPSKGRASNKEVKKQTKENLT